MKKKKNVIINSDSTIPLPEGVTWTEFITRINEEKNQQFLKKISPLTFKYILDDKNHSKVIKSLLKTIKQTDPQNATKDYAGKMLCAIQKIARMVLEN